MTKAVLLFGALVMVGCDGTASDFDAPIAPPQNRFAAPPGTPPGTSLDIPLFAIEPERLVPLQPEFHRTVAPFPVAVAPDAGAPVVVDAGTPVVVDAGTPVVVDAGTAAPDAGSSSPAPTPSACLRVMPLGDSITLGVNGGYRNTLYTSLKGSGCGVDFVGSQFDQYTVASDKNHQGHPGFTIGNISAQVDSWLAGYTPDYVLLMIGTNDVAWWSADNAAQIADRHAALVDKILLNRPNAWVIVGSIPPISSGNIQPNNVDRAQLGRDFNAAVQTRMATRAAAGKRVRFADVASKLTLSDLYDGVHPSQAAHAKVAAAFFQVMAPATACTTPATSCGP